MHRGETRPGRKGEGRAGRDPVLKVKGRPPLGSRPLELDRLAVPFNDPGRISPDQHGRQLGTGTTFHSSCPR